MEKTTYIEGTNEENENSNEYEERAYDVLITDPRTGQPITVAFHEEEFKEIIEEKQSNLLRDTMIRITDDRSIVVRHEDILVEN